MNYHKFFKLALYSFITFLLTLFAIPLSNNEASEKVLNAVIEKPFKQIFLTTPGLMDNDGARVIKIDPTNSLAIIGISRIESQSRDSRDLIRIGAIQARANIIKFSHGVDVSIYSRSNGKHASGNNSSETMSVSTFFQVAEERAAGIIKQLPVVGSWWTQDRTAFYVAVGMIKSLTGSDEVLQTLEDKDLVSISPNTSSVNITGQSTFVSLLHAFPALRDNGGVRVFSINNQKKVVMAVAFAKLGSSPAQAERVARIKAVRELLAHKNGVKLSTVDYLEEYENIKISNKETTYVMLSDFLSIQEESVNGFVYALPMMARWISSDEQTLYVGIGKIFE